MNTIPEQDESADSLERKVTQASHESQTASDYIDRQLELEADAREVLPYKFDSCSLPLGPLRQSVFACLTCNPPPASPAQLYTPAGVCYSCSISCHGEHTLVELFSRRNFVCDCGTSRISSNSPCMLRTDPNTGKKGAYSEEPAAINHYNHNFQNRFCGCGEEYDAEREKGTMFQCLGLGTVETGGCGEDWWHPECLMGLPRDWSKIAENEAIDQKPEERDDIEGDQQPPPGFPDEDDFEYLICYKCVESNPWIKKYAGAPGFLPPVFKEGSVAEFSTDDQPQETTSLKRKVADEEDEDGEDNRESTKRVKSDDCEETLSVPSKKIETSGQGALPRHKHDSLPPTTSKGTFSLFLHEDFREHLCHCPSCFPNLLPHPQLVEEEETYAPSVSSASSSNGQGSSRRSHGTGSLLDRGEAALVNNVDRVRAIEGVMVYNHLRDKVKEFLKPYAQSGTPVAAEDIKAYFEKLRGDDAAIREASRHADHAGGRAEDGGGGGGGDGDAGDGKEEDHRREQRGY